MIAIILLSVVLALCCLAYSFYAKMRENRLLATHHTPVSLVDKDGRIVKILNSAYVSETPFDLNKCVGRRFREVFDNEEDKLKFEDLVDKIVHEDAMHLSDVFKVADTHNKHYSVMIELTDYSEDRVCVYMKRVNESDIRTTRSSLGGRDIFFDAIALPVFVRDLQGRWVFINAATEKLFMFDAKKYIGQNDLSFLEPEAKLKLEDCTRKVMSTNQPDTFSFKTIMADGKEHSFTVNLTMMMTAESSVVLGTLMDASTSLVQKREMQLVREQFGLALKDHYVQLWTWDLTKDSIVVNSSEYLFPSEALFVQTEEEMLHGVLESDRPRLIAAVESLKEGKSEEMNIEFQQKTFDGNAVWNHTRAVVFERDAAGKATVLIGCTSDISEQKRMAVMQKEEQDHVAVSNDNSIKIITNIGYIVNTPLSSIMAYAQLLEDENDAETRKVYVEALQKDTSTLQEKLNNLIQITNVQSGNATFLKQPVELNGVFTECVDLAKNRMGEKNIDVRCDMPEQSTTLMLDSRYFMIVMENLIDNAIQYTQRGTITIGYDLQGYDKVYIYVRDTGQGMAEERVEMLLNSYSKEGINNFDSGLGITLCKAIVSRFGGEMGIKSQVGKGTEVWFTLNKGY